jgi:DNA polymerase III alpha subunit
MSGGNSRDTCAWNIFSVSAHAKLSIILHRTITHRVINVNRYGLTLIAPPPGGGWHLGETVVACGLIVEQRVHHQITGEPMKFLTLADWTGMVETELFAATYKTYGLATVRYPVLEIMATVEPFENGRGFSLRVLRASKPRMIKIPSRVP